MRLVLSGLCLLGGCTNEWFQNSAPELASVNGVAVSPLAGIPEGAEALRFSPGELFEIDLEVRDPEGHTVRIWWPEAPRGWRFPSDDTRGEWEVPPAEDYFELPTPAFTVILEDRAESRPRMSTWFIPFWTDAEETQWTDTGN